ncbi:ABC multidrug transporter SitT [Cordyceps fumosorosea ARSEF 2679]|uniref:ABC multidrug transporter SitT n=1 Tax=Cordyceps fumosorosea (strain ARSEF 2679) TaxID=1081104 RepID=A0A167I8H0_CORFA|nr:ABC multidrug transporter SitT [Cordyceps fumosorosea ARSEF 2679]OAA48785.1 ABC multidrug transporter SitT [Cordyceps fumosorosea ARSEF 2679]
MAAEEKDASSPEKAGSPQPPPASAEVAKDADKGKEKKGLDIGNFFVYFRLLFAAQPTIIDILLIVAGTICAAAAGVPFPLMGVLFGQLVDDFNSATCAAQDGGAGADPFRYESAINDKVAKTAWIGAIALVLIYCHLTCWGIVSQRLARRMRHHYLAALLRQPPSFFDERGSAGEVSSRLQSDIAAIQSGTSEKVGTIITTISFIATVFVIAFSTQASLAGILISVLPAFLISGTLSSKYIARFLGKQNEAADKASSVASEALSHIPVVHAFGAAGRLEGMFTGFMLDARSSAIKKAAVASVQTGLLYFIAYSANALAFWQGSIRIGDAAADNSGGSSIGQIYAIVYLLIDACVMLGGLAPLVPYLGSAVAAYKRLMGDIETPSSIDATSDSGDKLAPDAEHSVSFRNVTFEYPTRPGQPALRDVSLEFPAGKHTALVGLSGSGKSTVASLIARLHDPTSGTVEMAGRDLRALNVRSLRGAMTFVQQQPSLFDCSVLENIALGLVNSPRPEHQDLKAVLDGPLLAEAATKGREALSWAASQGEAASRVVELVIEAAEKADAATFIAGLTLGYGTSVGPRGTFVSGGQRQRIALAQALVRDPGMLILDEATASVDSASERKIQAAIEREAARGRRTIISIAHRLSTIKGADNIVVMEAGRVMEQGTYAELMAIDGGKFAHLIALQKMGAGDDGGAPESSRSSTNDVDEKMDKAEVTSTSDEKAVPKAAAAAAKEAEDDDATAKQPFSSVLKGIAWLVRPSLGWLAIALVAAAIVGATFSGSGLIFGYTVGALNPCQNTVDGIKSMGRFFAGMIFMLGAVELVANFLAWLGFGIIGERTLLALRRLSFRSLLAQDLAWHSSEGRTPTRLLSVITKDCMAIGGFSGSTFGTVFAVCVNIIIAIVVSHVYAWKIALVTLVTIPVLLGCGIMQLRVLARFEERHNEAFATANALATEAVQSIRSVATLSLERTYMNSYRRLLEPPARQIVRSAALTNIMLALSHSLSPFVNGLTYWWGSQLIMRGEYTQRDLLIVLVAMLTSAQLWGTMFTLAPEFSRARLALARVMAVIHLGSDLSLDERRDTESSAEGRTPSPFAPGQSGVTVAFKDVSFSYPGNPDSSVLSDVSFSVKPRQFVGLVGPSGAGKSTIMNLVQKLYAATSGAVLIDDMDISTLPDSFRDVIALVPQDPALFEGTVRHNVALGAVPGHEATDAEVEEACRVANIHEEIMALPDGYDTACGPSASRLSGGQRQRVAIARALVRKPRLLLLDESTSALDAAGEAALQEGLERASRGTTVLAITHRLHTVHKADVILVVEGGRIVDQGRHAELVERNESYRLNAMQQMLQ